MSSPTLRRAFSFALLLHVLLISLLLVGVWCWPTARVIPGPAGLVLDVAEPLPTHLAPDESPVIERALADIPPESREMPLPELPEIHSTGIPEPLVAPPDREDVSGLPVLPPEDRFMGGERRDMPSSQTPGSPPAKVEARSVAGAGQGQGSQPIALTEILPHYPYRARVLGETGRVTVHVTVSDKGEVKLANVVVSSGHPALDESAIIATKKARFKPAEQADRPVPSEMNLQFEFRLEDR